MLYRCSVQGLTNFMQPRFARFAVVGCGTDLDQFMRFQAALNFDNDGRRQSQVTDSYDRVKCMSLGFERAALDGG